MPNLSRRSLLGGSLAAGAAALISQPASADPTTPIPTNDRLNGHLLPNDTGLGYRGYRVLELFLYGAVAPWDTFYWMTAGASPSSRHAAIDDTLRPGFVSCGLSGNPSLFLGASGGRPDVYWGPALEALAPWRSRARVITHNNTFGLHPLAIPLQMTGLRFGSPRLAGAGAAIHRRFRDATPTAIFPRAYVLNAGFSQGDNVGSFCATGEHGGSNRPVQLATGMTLTDDVRAFDRRGTTSGRNRTVIDPLIDVLRQGYRDRLTPAGLPRLRSAAFDDLESAYRYHHHADDLYSVLNGHTAYPTSTPRCDGETRGSFETGQAIDLAAHLLSTSASDGGLKLAAYVGILDSGITRHAGAGYDTHGGDLDNYRMAIGGNLTATLRHLATRLTTLPGGEAGKINLNDTMVIITTEFGREPGISRDAHFNAGYASVVFGGPYQRASAHGISGSLDPATGRAPELYPAPAGAVRLKTTPTAFRAALLMAAGIDPIEPSTVFSTGDLEVTAPAADIRTALARDVLGFA